MTNTITSATAGNETLAYLSIASHLMTEPRRLYMCVCVCVCIYVKHKCKNQNIQDYNLACDFVWV
jgi:hypothetical protein